MSLKEGSTLYVRTDYKIGEKTESEQDGMECMQYLQSIAKDRYLVAGLLGDIEAGVMDGAMVIYEAKDLEEAQQLAENDPIIKKGFYRCEVRKWNLALISEKA